MMKAKYANARFHLEVVFGIGVSVAGGLLLNSGRIEAASPSPVSPADSSLLPPLATSPQPSAKANAVAVPYKPWMPPARASREPRALASDGHYVLHARAAIDGPPVHDPLADSTAALPALAVGPAIRMESPDPAIVPVALIGAKRESGNAVTTTDPTLEMAKAGALILSPPPRITPAPLLLLPIPDPSRQASYIPANQPEKEDAPLPGFDRPALPILPNNK